VLGDPTEGALLAAARKRGPEIDLDRYRLEHEIPFDSTRKTMSKTFRGPDGRRVMYVKGAPEAILRRSKARRVGGEDRPLDDDARRTVRERNDEMAGRALRVLGLAQAADPPAGADEAEAAPLVFLGLVGMIDPPRDEVREAVARCRGAGIRPVMITGDHPATAAAIARELGIADDRTSGTLVGSEIDKLDDAALDARVEQTAVYARVSAEHKLRVVRSWKRRGQIVAMTGDGVNDAPAVKAADIGIAMGITGTDVTQSASDMVLTDDNFASIINAVEEGRGILDNIRKVIHYLLACNAGEVLLMLLAALAGLPVPLSALMILWINLVTDGLPALALAVEPPEENLMRRRPRPPEASLISRRQALVILGHGLAIALASLAAFWTALAHFAGDVAAARVVAFGVAAFAQLFFALGCRSERVTLWRLGLLTNRPLLYAVGVSAALQIAALAVALRAGEVRVAADPLTWLIMVGLSLVPLALFEIGKAFGGKSIRASTTPTSETRSMPR
jgi:Ca2+-transporting ATPase